MSFWEIVGFIAAGFVFVATLMVMFTIIGDLFRDRELSGVAKAAWVVALVFVPLLTALVYVVARGRGMAERSQRAAAAAKQEQETYIREVAGRTTAVDQIAQAKAMLDAGAISNEEFETLKARALAGAPVPLQAGPVEPPRTARSGG